MLLLAFLIAALAALSARASASLIAVDLVLSFVNRLRAFCRCVIMRLSVGLIHLLVRPGKIRLCPMLCSAAFFNRCMYKSVVFWT